MKMKKIVLGILSVFMLSVLLAGCGSSDNSPEPAATPLLEQMVREGSVSALAGQGNTVEYTVKVYQDQYHNVTVRAESTEEDYAAMEYEIDYDKNLSASDVDIRWTTATGSTKPKENEQWAIAQVSISSYGQVINQRNVNFPERTIETVTEVTH